MTAITSNLNEQATAEAFSRQSRVFDEIYAGNTIVTYKRERVRARVLNYLKPNSNILELNSGTGEDATFFAEKGHRVHATDISTGMQTQLRKKAALYGLDQQISTELCSYTNLSALQNQGPYDLIFSNFAGLNCTDKLDGVLLSLSPLLKTGGFVTLVLLPKFCLWETLLIFKGKFRTALRRFNSKGTTAHIEGTYFKCWYYNPAFVISTLQYNFNVLNVEGLCTLVPPSYIENFAEKHPKSYDFLKRLEDKLKGKWPFKLIGDYYIITLQKR
ncbi:ubiquinone/menaquinone biosynthesis C-methylase UbiE [Mucilaginibacter gracilis]|uniref:Ubiquinone/menaquinone biosynthesis C-methylase UbiE n=1 Tax=Mucilaginibacter gracilis TaxID=423350 RepID=A0A495J3L5_9SPHI|nr:class I SAM-dependent methyltransferase [Mucilaginibacter gracilis]RKR83537.1 ubiquinone/menaquinone biosynthesis C-methylase UbiE [Mucilaginibacter gracilis]